MTRKQPTFHSITTLVIFHPAHQMRVKTFLTIKSYYPINDSSGVSPISQSAHAPILLMLRWPWVNSTHHQPDLTLRVPKASFNTSLAQSISAYNSPPHYLHPHPDLLSIPYVVSLTQTGPRMKRIAKVSPAIAFTMPIHSFPGLPGSNELFPHPQPNQNIMLLPTLSKKPFGSNYSFPSHSSHLLLLFQYIATTKAHALSLIPT